MITPYPYTPLPQSVVDRGCEEKSDMSKSPVESVLEHQAENGASPAAPTAALNGAHSPGPGSGDDPSRRRLPAPRALLRSTARNLGPRKLSAVYLWVLFFIVFSAIDPSTFPTSVTFRLVPSRGVV